MSDLSTMSFPRQHAATRRFTLGAPRNFSVVADTSHAGGTATERVLFLRSKAGDDPVLCLWAQASNGPEQLIVDPAKLGADDDALPAAELARRERARESAGGIVSYSVDAAGRAAAFTVGGALFVVDLATNETRMLDAAEGVFDPQIDPTGRSVAYVSDRALHLIGIREGSTDQVLAHDVEPTVSWGRAEFVAAEEMGRTRGFWWAPDGSALLVTRVDDAPVQIWHIADPAHPARAPHEIRYPAAGTMNSTVQLALIALDGSQQMVQWNPTNDQGVGAFEYLADVVWSKGKRPLVVRQTRDQRTVSIGAVEQGPDRRGDLVVVERQTITDPVWVELMPGSPAWAGSSLLTIEDRADLDRRVLCVDGDPVDLRGLHVRSIVATGPTSVLLTAWTDPLDVHVVLVDLESGEPTTLTTEPGVHGASASSPLGAVVLVRSAPDLERSVAVALWPKGPERTISNRGVVPALTAVPHFHALGARELRSAVFLPNDHDGVSQLPVLLDPYGGPHAQRVTRSHTPHLTSQWFADQGFAVIVTDGRGTPGRGPAFEREVWGNLADPVLEDQIDALDAAAAIYPFIDLDRVGIRGWSFGGYLAALAVLRAPDRVHAAIAGAPVTTWHLYDTHYTERYLGHPDQFGDHYAVSDLILDAAKLTRPLLLIHGLADDNVVAAHTLRFSSALLAGGRSHQVLPLSGVTHMTPQEVVAENLLHLQRDFLFDAVV